MNNNVKRTHSVHNESQSIGMNRTEEEKNQQYLCIERWNSYAQRIMHANRIRVRDMMLPLLFDIDDYVPTIAMFLIQTQIHIHT